MSDSSLHEAQRLIQAGRLGEAADVCRDFLNSNPGSFEAHCMLGRLDLRLGRIEQARMHLDEAVRIDPSSPKAHYLRGMMFFEIRRHREALDSFDRALSFKPDHIEALSNRAMVLLEMNRATEALAGFDAALAIDKGHAVNWSNRANALLACGRYEEALTSYDRALGILPEFHEARNNRVYALGMTYFQAGKFEEAQRNLEEAVRLNPLLAGAFCMRGIALMRLKRHPEALLCFDRALSLSPGFVEALSNRATALLELNRSDEALSAFDAVLAVDPQHAKSWNNRGNALADAKRYEDALASYDRALAIQPDFAEAKDNRVNVLFALHRMARCPPALIRTLFDNYCSYYESAMVEGLGYRSHLHLRSLAERVFPPTAPPWRILDLGCGTGLVGDVFKDLARGGRLDGIDISPKMIEAARQRGIYDDLVLGDLETVLKAPGRCYDLVLAADTLVYFGDLAPTFAGVMERLEHGGYFLFAVESKEGEGWKQTPADRFCHSEAYLRAEAVRAGFAFVDILPCLLRREKNEPVAGFAVALQRPTPGK